MARRPDVNGRELILKAALRLFSREGPDAVSIRAVNREAGLGPASVHYHFGTKDALVDALIERHAVTVVEDVLERSRTLQHGEITPRAVIEALAIPYWTLLATDAEGWEWIRLIGWLMSSQPERVQEPEVDALVAQAVLRCFPDANPAEVDQTLQMAFQLLISHLTSRPHHGRRLGNFQDDAAFTRLLAFLSGGLRETLQPSGPCRENPTSTMALQGSTPG
ncbi:TetR family transcriptional regulator [Intrasporangium sp.]|uniref:TetR/AcrR family transcriptional regulator n=1 Tax=Intrasporangium sp. TaxID=1925024 RepID=UPI0032215D04